MHIKNKKFEIEQIFCPAETNRRMIPCRQACPTLEYARFVFLSIDLPDYSFSEEAFARAV